MYKTKAQLGYCRHVCVSDIFNKLFLQFEKILLDKIRNYYLKLHTDVEHQRNFKSIIIYIQKICL